MTWGLPAWVFDWAGYLGVAFYLGSYALLQAGMIRGSSLTYTLMNLFAASLVLVSLMMAFNMASALTQISWIVISCVGLARLAMQSRGLRFSQAETQMMRGPLAQMNGAMARRFFDAGQWTMTKSECRLTEEGTPVQTLHFIASGRADVFSGHSQVARLTAGFVGELNVMEAGPASATVIAAQGCEIFSISGQTLRKLADRDSDFRMALDRALSHDTASKLRSANQNLALQRIT